MSLRLESQFIYRYAECRYSGCSYAECRYVECRYSKCHYAECRYSECRMLSVVAPLLYTNHTTKVP